MDLNIFGRSTLGRGLMFNEDDLTYNRLGMLSPRQRRRFTVTAWGFPIFFLVVVIACFGWMPWGEFVQQLTRPYSSWIERGLLWFVALLLASVIFGLPVAGLYLQRKMLADVRANTVATVTGIVRRDRELSPELVRFTVYVGPQAFQLHYGGWRAFTPGQRHTVYYLPRTRQIIAAERAEDDLPDYFR